MVKRVFITFSSCRVCVCVCMCGRTLMMAGTVGVIWMVGVVWMVGLTIQWTESFLVYRLLTE